jgi:hypothetical protein
MEEWRRLKTDRYEPLQVLFQGKVKWRSAPADFEKDSWRESGRRGKSINAL